MDNYFLSPVGSPTNLSGVLFNIFRIYVFLLIIKQLQFFYCVNNVHSCQTDPGFCRRADVKRLNSTFCVYSQNVQNTIRPTCFSTEEKYINIFHKFGSAFLSVSQFGFASLMPDV